MIKLSILIPSVHTRFDTFLPKIMRKLYEQRDNLSDYDKLSVEILTLIDTKSIMLGDKRNELVNLSSGEYVVFVDDDDDISDCYVKSLLDATKYDKDIIVFDSWVTINGDNGKICHYSVDYVHDYNTDDAYFRLPNHICCVKREYAIKVKFPSVLYGEDSGYSKLLAKEIKSEHKINDILYKYMYNQESTETQMHLKPRRNTVDIVILSNAKTERHKSITDNCILSLKANCGIHEVNIIVVEQNKEAKYDGVVVKYMDCEFNYNKFANIGSSLGTSNYIVVANNDVIFCNKWLDNLLSVNYPVVSPKCPNHAKTIGLEGNIKGYECGVHFSGWCFMIQRSIYAEIGGFDEDFSFYCADNAVIEQLKAIDIMPMLVCNSTVVHVGSQTLSTLSADKTSELTFGQVYKFNKKYNKDIFCDSPVYNEWVKFNT